MARYRLRVSNAQGWSDKVFSAHYTLRPLPDVADYVAKQGHLPGVTSATDMTRQGADMAQLMGKLLEKIEELMLYAIDQQEQTKRGFAKQQQQLNTLQAENRRIRRQLDRRH